MQTGLQAKLYTFSCFFVIMWITWKIWIIYPRHVNILQYFSEIKMLYSKYSTIKFILHFLSLKKILKYNVVTKIKYLIFFHTSHFVKIIIIINTINCLFVYHYSYIYIWATQFEKLRDPYFQRNPQTTLEDLHEFSFWRD